jgi:REP element-mobilizing transposase RayT
MRAGGTRRVPATLRAAYGVWADTLGTSMIFNLFDPKIDLRITAGNLPHWYQPGVTYFVTYRTNDSFPASVANRWYCRRDDWLRRHDIDPASPGWKARLRELPDPQQNEFDKNFSSEYLEHLDRGHGECVLRRPDLAAIVAENIRHFDGERYILADFVVMPNHVHLLVCLLGATDIEGQCSSWKKYTATKINKALGQHGRFWHEESFDHLVRTPDHFAYFRRYIADNPNTARLHQNEYLHWSRQ